MQDITIPEFLSLSPVLDPVDICIVQFFASSPYPEVWKARKGIAKNLNVGDSTVYRSVKRLEALALLSVERFPGGTKVNRYKLDRESLFQLIQDMGEFVAFEEKEKEPLLSEWLKIRGYLGKKGKLDLFRLACDYPSFQLLSDALESASLSESLSVPAQPTVSPSGLRASGEPSEPQIDPQYLTLAQQVQDRQVKPGLLRWLKEITMLSSSGDLDLPRLTATFPNFQDFCSGFEQQVTEVKSETCSITDGLKIVQFPVTKQDPTADNDEKRVQGQYPGEEEARDPFKETVSPTPILDTQAITEDIPCGKIESLQHQWFLDAFGTACAAKGITPDLTLSPTLASSLDDWLSQKLSKKSYLGNKCFYDEKPNNIKEKINQIVSEWESMKISYLGTRIEVPPAPDLAFLITNREAIFDWVRERRRRSLNAVLAQFEMNDEETRAGYAH